MEEPLARRQGDPALLGSTEGARRATGVEPSRAAAAAGGNGTLDSEVPEKPERRTFTAEYKLRVLELAAQEGESRVEGALRHVLSEPVLSWEHVERPNASEVLTRAEASRPGRRTLTSGFLGATRKHIRSRAKKGGD